MIQNFIYTILGPSGMSILSFYDHYSLYINGIIILLAIVALLAPRRSQMLKAKLAQFWAKTPLAADEKDRKAIEAARARLAAAKARRR